MAFDQVSLFLYPPCWDRKTVEDAQATTWSGEPVQIVSDSRVLTGGTVVRSNELHKWFESRGFEVLVKSSGYIECRSARVRTFLGQRPEIYVGIGVDSNEVTSLYCRFLLTQTAPDRLAKWQAFMRDLCCGFELRIGVADGVSVGAGQFLDIVCESDRWRSLAAQFGWANRPESGSG